MKPRLRATLLRFASSGLSAQSRYHDSGVSRIRPTSLLIGRSRAFSTSYARHIKSKSDASHSQPAENLNHNVTKEEEEHYHQKVVENKNKQIRTPWHREGSDEPPVAKQRSAGAMTKGKLLTTPSRMLKLILPLTTRDANTDRKDVEPLALLVHPQQPLSYLERLIQSELPLIKKDGKERVPEIYFRAVDSMQTSLEPPKKDNGEEEANTSLKEEEEREEEPDKDEQNAEDRKHREEEQKDLENPDKMRMADGETAQTGKLNRRTDEEANALRGGPGQGGVESYSGLGQERDDGQDDSDRKFVRWSSSTEIGDFIRDAARGKEFSLEIEGAPNDIYVGVPSFNDRTYYLRMRLRNTAKKISTMADVKGECESIAHKHAQRVAFAGFGGLCGWWYVVYRLTFETELGWDVMEPVTYLVGLSTLIGGYMWFLYHNREVSYRSAMNITISRRLSKLYQQRGFDVRKWENLIEEGNALRKEIKAVANEYDVEWEEMQDEKNEKVAEALRKEREKKKGNSKAKKDGKDEDDD